MPLQTVPHIEFNWFVFGKINDMFEAKKIFINEEYQRGDIWKTTQKIELIQSILDCYSIGVLVLYKNERGEYEILDGQQRLQTIRSYTNGTLDLMESGIPLYSEIDADHKTLLDAYCVYYLELKSYDSKTKEESIVQTFLRLQEGTPLNKAEKINAYRGKYKDTFLQAREKKLFFDMLGKEKRFRWRQLAAEMLLLELEGNFSNKTFPNLDLKTLIEAATKYEKIIPKDKVKSFLGNLDVLYSSLNYLLTAFTPRESIAFYLLVSYLRKHRAGNQKLENELFEFANEFLHNLNRFSIYDEKPPEGMLLDLFTSYKKYKQEAKILTTAESLRKRLEIMLSEFDRLHPIIIKDPKRLHDAEQKRTLYFRQKGLCKECGKEMKFNVASAHHVIGHAKGGSTEDLKNAVLLHRKCHDLIEKRLLKHCKK